MYNYAIKNSPNNVFALRLGELTTLQVPAWYIKTIPLKHNLIVSYMLCCATRSNFYV